MTDLHGPTLWMEDARPACFHPLCDVYEGPHYFAVELTMPEWSAYYWDGIALGSISDTEEKGYSNEFLDFLTEIPL